MKIDMSSVAVSATKPAGKGTGLADMLKPALARGDLALVAATTDEE